MPLFRFHRGSLEDSLKTTIIVKTFNEIVEAIVTSDLIKATKQDWGAIFKITPYPDRESNFDPRIGWYTHMVLSNIYEKDKMHPVGFLSEPLE
ncbi:MAG: hypothetical protein Q8936_14175 [Bacillota bacterium]|nr:hypothetical protein [Bacillota bacterium]